jgi:hypothetical protein
MDHRYKRTNEILESHMASKAEMLKELGLPVVENLAYNRGTKDIKLPIEEVEALMEDLIITVNRYRELQHEGNDVTLDHVVSHVITKVSHFDALMFKYYIEH